MNYYTIDGCSYAGMDQDTIIRLRTELGLETVFVAESDFHLTQVEAPSVVTEASVYSPPPPSIEDRLSALEAKVDTLLNGK